MTLTPEQFDKLVTKDYLEEKLAEKLENMATKEDVDKILTAVDGIARKHQEFEVELISNQVAHDRFKTRIKQLEKQKTN